jgi:hypothetical protein
MTAADGRITVWGDGREARDLLYVSDLVDYVSLAIDQQTAPFELHNVGLGRAITVAELGAEDHRPLGATPRDRLRRDSARPCRRASASTATRARRTFGWTPAVALDEGIRRTIAWYRRPSSPPPRWDRRHGHHTARRRDHRDATPLVGYFEHGLPAGARRPHAGGMRRACGRTARGLPSFLAGEVSPANNPHRTHAEFLGALSHPDHRASSRRSWPAARSRGLQTQVLFTVPGTPGFSVHQDNFYIGTAPDALVSAWVALEDADRSQTARRSRIPGSHREPVLPVEDVPDAAPHPGRRSTASACARGAAELRTHDLDVPAGAVVFIHGQLLHGSHTPTRRRGRA